MNANGCIGFEDLGDFFGVLANWDKFSGEATYLIVGNRAIHRLNGDSDIIYIGQSKRFGGDSSSRLWNYRYAAKGSQELRVREVVGDLTSDGVTISLHVCQEPPDGQTVQIYESELLSRYKTDHWELPPCNFQR